MLIPNTTQVPNVLFDSLLSELSDAELRVLLYIMRRTYGFQKHVDRISFSQFEKGITRPTGEVLDKGCGITRKYISQALESLVACGVVLKTDDSRGNFYELNLEASVLEVVAKRNQFHKETKSGSERKPKVVAKGNIQNQGNQGNQDIAAEPRKPGFEPVNPKTFFLKDELRKLEDSPQRHLNIIAMFLEKRFAKLKPKILNNEQYKVFLSQHLKWASQLKVYEDDQLLEAIEAVSKKYPTIDWNLHTVLTELVK